MSATTHRTIKDRAGMIERYIRRMGLDSAEWDLSDLKYLTYIEHEVAQARTRAVLALRELGESDAAIAAEMGTTRQAVSKRWPGGGRFVGAAGRYRTPTQPTESKS